jgi:hypothetical protein
MHRPPSWKARCLAQASCLACRDAVVGVVGALPDKDIRVLLAAFQKVKVPGPHPPGKSLKHSLPAQSKSPAMNFTGLRIVLQL